MRHAFRLFIKPGMEEEYDRRHRAVDPELLQVFREAGVITYSIFRDGAELFGYLEIRGDDVTSVLSNIGKHPSNKRWQRYMMDLLDYSHEPSALEEVFVFRP